MRNVESPAEIEESPSSNQPQVVGLSRNYANHGNSRIRDPFIIIRVNQYLNENRHRIYFDINDMVDALRRRYKEYRRRNWGQFKILVERAFNVIAKKTRGEDMDLQESSSSDEVEECNVTDDRGPSHSSNSQVLQMYQPQAEAATRPSNNSTELINLSSDDEATAQHRKEKTDEGAGAASVPKPKENTSQGNNAAIVQILRMHQRKATQKKLQKRKVVEEDRKVTFADFAGFPSVLEEVCKLVLHIKHPESYERLGVSAPRGFLLHGPPGCGKTLLANAIAGELNVELIKVSGPELVGGVSGESEERIRDLFDSAVEAAPCVIFIDEVDAVTPNRMTAQREMERRIVAQLLTSLDGLSTSDKGNQVLVIGATNRPDSLDPALRRAGRFDREVCLGIPDATAREKILKLYCEKINLADELDLKQIALMTPGYVGADLLSLMREAAMNAIARVYEELVNDKETKNSKKRKRPKNANPVSTEPDKKRVASESNGVVQEEQKKDKDENSKIEDVTSSEVVDMVLVDEKKNEESSDSEMDVVATDSEVDEIVSVDVISPNFISSLIEWIRNPSPLTPKQLERFCIKNEDISAALKTVQPSAKREGFATVPDVTWNDIGSLATVREHLKMTILGPLKYQAQFEHVGLVAPAGVLLCGPPGCGKTLLAKAVANEAGINFISVKGPELMNMYVGESERAVRQVFQRARNSAPCVIFFDELDSLCPRRMEGDSGGTMRVVNQMLTEMDGVGDRRGVFLMAATNRPDIVDPAVLRPGRLDKTVYIGLPSSEDRADILRTITKDGKKPPLSEDVALEELAANAALDNFSGADLAALVREASMEALREAIQLSTATQEIKVTKAHFEAALLKVRPSISPEDRERYEDMKKEFAEVPISSNAPL